MSETAQPRPARSRLRRWAISLAASLAGIVVLSFVALATMDRWYFSALDPGPFVAALTPPAPDYTQNASWAALPETEDGADVALPSHPAIDQQHALATVFYVHPTTWLGKGWNGPIDDPIVIEATTNGGTLIQASAFNGCCAVYAPRYRQANGRAFAVPDERGQQAIDVAYADVDAAFTNFLARIGDRPFIIAGHSQGAVLATRLVHERISATPLQERMIAAYLPGSPIRPGMLGEVPLCEAPTRTGCAVSWHARGPDYEPNGFELESTRPDTMADRACVNPISWTTDGTPAPATANAGAIFFDTETPKIKPVFADAQCQGGTLLVSKHGDLERDFKSTILLWVMGPDNYHPVEYQLFYLDIRANAAARTQAWLDRQADGPR